MSISIKENGRRLVEVLVQKFRLSYSEYKNVNYNETQLRIDFINPLLEALGWDVFNGSEASQHLREVIQEDTVSVEEEGFITKKKPDYALCLNGKRKMFVEVKKPSVPIESAIHPVFQVRRYGWNARLPVSMLTNFDKIIIYDCRFRPIYGDDVRNSRINTYDFEDILTKFDEIYEQFSSESVLSGKFDEIFSLEEKRVGSEPFDEYFLEQIEKWRWLFAKNLVNCNDGLKQEELNFLVQKLINRIVFLRICEDRELESYKGLLEIQNYDELKIMFKKADEKYNSGLFDFLEDELSLNVKLSDNLLIGIFMELYYPESPYAFTVVESSVIGEIYEHFLAREIKIIENKEIIIVEKPEVVESNGVVTTPRFIVESIIQKTISPLCFGKSPEELLSLKIADIACGSGVFLLSAFEFLLSYHLDWYLNNNPLNYREQIIDIGLGRWKLTLFEKQKILKNNIYGVDIDLQAIEVARFSLLLKVLENETTAAIDTHLSRHRMSALPKLDENIQCGNSLVDFSYFKFYNEDINSHNQLINVNAFDWKSSFKNVFSDGGFDVIIGNPPYIRMQNMVKYSPLEIEYYRSGFAPYQCANSDNFDKYILFIERSLLLLKQGGCLGVIVPHKFFTIRAGTELRKILSRGKLLNEIVHFGVEQVFKGKLTYTCILKLIKQSNESFTIEHVANLRPWIYGQSGVVESYPASEVSSEPWIFLHPQLKSLFNDIRERTTNIIKDIADVFVGIQTSADDIYIVHPLEETEELVHFIDLDGRAQTIEKGILRPFFHDVKFLAFGKPRFNAYLIFPYKEFIGKKAILYSSDEMQEFFPRCLKYLSSYRDVLLRRKVKPAFTEENWFKFGRSQSLTLFNGEPKLVWTVLSLEPKYVYDDKDIIFSGGGNGPYYGLRVKADNPHSIFYIQAVLCHPLIEAIVKTGKTSKFQGGYYSHGKQFVDELPFRAINFNKPAEVEVHNKIVEFVQQLILATDNKINATIPHTRILYERNCARLKEQINELLNELYEIDQKSIKVIEELV